MCYFLTSIILFALCANPVLRAQNQAIDSLQKVLSKPLPDTTRVNTLLALSSELQEADIEEAMTKAISALDLAKHENYLLGQAAARSMIGELHFAKREIEKSLSALDKAIELYQRLDDERQAMAVLERKIQIYYNASEYEDAIAALRLLLDYWTSEADTSEMTTNLNRLAICYEEIGDLEKSIEMAQEGYDLSMRSNDLEGAALNMNNIGFVHRAKGEPDKALESFQKAAEIAAQIGRKDMEATFHQNVGIVHGRAGRSVKALEAYFISLEMFESIDEKGGASDILHNIGLVYKKNGELEKALDYYMRSLAYDLEQADTSDITISYLNIGNAYKVLEQFDSAKIYLTSAYDIAKSSDRRCFGGEAGALGDLFYQEGNLALARRYTQEEIDAAKNCGNTGQLATALLNMGLINKAQGRRQAAFTMFSQSYKAAVDYDQLLEQKLAAEALYEWYKAAGNQERALYYHERFQQVSDSLFNQENTRQMAWMSANYQMDLVTDSLTRETDKQARLLNMQIEEEQRQQRQILLAALAAMLLISGYFLYRRKQRQLRYQQALLEEKNAGFKAVITATEEERKRIAKDLHDGVVQQIGAVKLALTQLVPTLPKEAASEVTKITKITEATAQETRAISHQMMPKVLIEMGLLPAMKDVIEKSLTSQNIEVNLEEFGLQERYADSIEVTIYRIFQELVNNIVKHANATKVEVQLFQNGDKIILVVEDNGSGMTEGKTSGIGLDNIKSRLTTLDGKVDYASSPQSGTVATIVIPI